MMDWTRRHTLIAGTALIALTNLAALSGVAYNRSGTPDSVLKLSQREVELPYRWHGGDDNSGISLSLAWRVADMAQQYPQYRNRWSEPAWLDEAKMKSLGFDVSSVNMTDDNRLRVDKQRPREVFLALEFDGPSYRQALEKAKEAEAGERKKGERPTTLERELNTNSRLFVVDAGLDRETLRGKYPDTAHYAIVRGKVGMAGRISGGKWQFIAGNVEELGVESINVPLEFRAVFEPLQRKNYGYDAGNDAASSFEATIAFGKRLEPWLVAAAAK